MKKLITIFTMAGMLLCTGAVFAQRPAEDSPRTPTPRLPDGTVDLGGNGVWNLPYVTNIAARMEGFDEGAHRWDYIYEPDARQLIEGLITRFIESQVYQAVVENVACEQAAKMIAMKSATDNAGDLVDELQLIMNNARQAAITQELSEIVSGAAAV